MHSTKIPLVCYASTVIAGSHEKEAHRGQDKSSVADQFPSQQCMNGFPFLYSKTEELVWNWEQSKLCDQCINIIFLQSTFMP